MWRPETEVDELLRVVRCKAGIERISLVAVIRRRRGVTQRDVGDKAWSLIYVNNSTLRGFFRLNRAGTAGFLGVNIIGDPAIDPEAAVNAAADVSESRLIELVRAGAGKPDLPVRIDGYSRWRATASVAERMREDRTFITGDAAHLMPPNGGFGGNTGIHDAHNLAWKLALVINRQAGTDLLDTYETERRPVAVFTVEQAFARYVARTAPWLAARVQPEPLVDDLHIELGYLYDSPHGVHADPRNTGGAPGSRAPHLWLERDGKRLSTLDLAGRYVLLAGAAGSAWVDAAREMIRGFRGLSLDAFCMGRDLADRVRHEGGHRVRRATLRPLTTSARASDSRAVAVPRESATRPRSRTSSRANP